MDHSPFNLNLYLGEGNEVFHYGWREHVEVGGAAKFGGEVR